MASQSPVPHPHPPAEPAAAFEGGAVVQLVSGDPGAPDAAVIALHPATVTVDSRCVTAVVDDDGDEWCWLLDELEWVAHGRDEPWSILGVPGVSDHGVAVAPDDVARFRRALVALGVAPAPAVSWPAAPSRPSFDPTPLEDLPPPDARDRLPDPDDTVAVPVVGPGADGELVGLEALGVSAWFGSHHVLDRVSLDMAPGQVTALIGPSGCGKSTFLRILNRMHELIPSASMAGEVRLGGDDIYDPERRLTDARRQIGMVFQKPNPFPAMSIYDNVVASFQLTGTKISKDEKDEVVERCLRKAGLWNEVRDRLRNPGGGLSGGQQQRLCIARALAIKPLVLLMDEPCSALDPTSTRRIEETIAELASEVTIVIVTHNMQQAARVSHQCAFFLAEAGTPGVIVERGPTDAMFSEPRDPRTNDYVNGRFG